MKDELKPCPFCGGEAKMFLNPDYDANCYVAYVRCSTVGCGAIIKGDDKPLWFGNDRIAELSARCKWNRRESEAHQ